MIPLLTADEMRAAERQAIEGWGVASLVLQEHAALGALALLPGDAQLHVLAGPATTAEMPWRWPASPICRGGP